MMKKVLSTLIVLIVLASSSFAGNGKTKALKGHVVDENGSPIAGAKVEIKGVDKAVYTDFEGEFIFPKISKTSYEINVSMVSFEGSTSTVDLASSHLEDFSITLEAK